MLRKLFCSSAIPPYYRIVVGPVFLIGATYALSSTLRAAGDTKSPPMKAAAISNIVNIILDYVLIFGILGIPGGWGG